MKRDQNILNRYEFEQMIAKAKVNLGDELVLKVFRATTAEFGWPLSPEGQIALLLQLAIRCRGH